MMSVMYKVNEVDVETVGYEFSLLLMWLYGVCRARNAKLVLSFKVRNLKPGRRVEEKFSERLEHNSETHNIHDLDF